MLKNINDVPVCTFIAVSLIIVFSLYTTSALKQLPCNNDVLGVFMSNFIHTDMYHVISNLYALYALSRVEEQLKPKKFFTLIIFILIFSSIIEVSVNRMFNLPCSIGFSGVLFGITTWEIVTKQKVDFYLITSIFAMVLLPSLKSKKISLVGHLVGAFAGIIAGFISKKLIL